MKYYSLHYIIFFIIYSLAFPALFPATSFFVINGEVLWSSKGSFINYGMGAANIGFQIFWVLLGGIKIFWTSLWGSKYLTYLIELLGGHGISFKNNSCYVVYFYHHLPPSPKRVCFVHSVKSWQFLWTAP